jgi:2-aminoadipate transaminase
MLDLPLTQLTHRPGIIDLAWGHPDGALLPANEMRVAAVAALDRWGAGALAYAPERGSGPLLEWLIERVGRTESRTPAPDEIMITGGVSQALDQICTLYARPGDVALVESPTYHLAVRILRDHPLDLVPTPADGHGLDVAALAETIADLRRAGGRPRLLYTVPTFHNPTSASLEADRRLALVELAAAEDLLVIEDDVYRDLSYDGPPPPSLWSMAPPGTVARLGSFAKSLAPGLRLGWMTAGRELIGRIAGGGLLDSGGGVNHFAAMVIAQFCASGAFEVNLECLRDAYRARRYALMAGLAAHLPPGCTWDVPAGGYFVWLRLPEGVDSAALLPRAEAAGVSYLPGVRFHLDGRVTDALRLSFSLYGETELTEAARRLGAVLFEGLSAPRPR